MLTKELMQCQEKAKQFKGDLIPGDCLDMMTMIYGSGTLRKMRTSKICVLIQMLLKAAQSPSAMKDIKSTVENWRKQ